MLPPFVKLNVSDYVLGSIQDNVEKSLRPVLASVIIDGVILQDVSLTAGSVTQVPHKLQRVPQFWVLAKQNANSVVWQSSIDSNFLNLNCSANCVVSLWVG